MSLLRTVGRVLSACEDEPAAFAQAATGDQLQAIVEITEPAFAGAGASQRDSDERQSGE